MDPDKGDDFPQFCDEIEFASETEWLDADQDYYDQPEEIAEVTDVDEHDDSTLHIYIYIYIFMDAKSKMNQMRTLKGFYLWWR